MPCSVEYVHGGETFEKELTFYAPKIENGKTTIIESTSTYVYLVDKLKINLPNNTVVQNNILSLASTLKSMSYISNYTQVNGKSYAFIQLFTVDPEKPYVGKSTRHLAVLLSYKNVPGSDTLIYELEGFLSQKYVMTLFEPKKVIKEDVVSDFCYSERMKSKEMIDQDIYVYNGCICVSIIKVTECL